MNLSKFPSISCLLILTTISGFVTTYLSYDLIFVIRIILMTLIIGVTIHIISSKSYSSSQLQSIGVCLFLFIYGFLLAIINDVQVQSWSQNLRDFTITICTVILFGYQHKIQKFIILKEVAKHFTYYVFFGLIIVYFLGGLSIEFPPKFIYEVANNEIMREETYSLSLTAIFCLAILFLVVMVDSSKNLFFKLSYIFILLLFIILAFVAGGRGEIISVLIVAGLFYAHESTIKNLTLSFMLIFLGLVTIFNAVENIDYLIGVERLSLLFINGDYSYRDVLIIQVIDLLLSEPKCLLIGCGTEFFQSYYGYSFGLFPHNYIAESIIIFGLPIIIIFSFLGVHGLILYYRKLAKIDLFLLIFFYQFLVGLKSGYFFGNWILNGAIIFFIGLSIDSLKKYQQLLYINLKKLIYYKKIPFPNVFAKIFI